MYRSSITVYGDRNRHVLDLEFIDCFHTEIFKSNDTCRTNGFGYEIGSTTNGNQIHRAVLSNRFDRTGPTFCFSNHADQPCFCEHHFCEFVHTCRSGRSGRSDHFFTDRVNRAHVVDQPIAKIYPFRQWFATSDQVGNPFVRCISSGENFAGQQ